MFPVTQTQEDANMASNNKQKATVKGSIAQLVGRVTVEGKTVGQAELSVLTRLGAGTFARVVEKIGQVDANGKAVKGRPTTIWEIDQNIRMMIDDNPEAVAMAHAQEAAMAEESARQMAAAAVAHAEAKAAAAKLAAEEAAKAAAEAQANLTATQEAA